MAFRPPAIKHLSDVDIADCKYGTELTEVVGLVSFSSQGGWLRSNAYTVHNFTLAAWRRVTGPLVERELLVLRPVAPSSDYFSDYPEGTQHRLQLLLSTDETRAIFAKLIKSNVKDTELEAIAVELQKPVVISTEKYGKLTLDRRINWFQGKTKWNGKRVEILFEADADLHIDSQLATADKLFSKSDKWGQAVNDFAIQELLDLANDWRDEDTKPITANQFLKRMRLKSISIQEDGRFEFWHDDGDLFAGHSIQVRGSLKEGLKFADIPG